MRAMTKRAWVGAAGLALLSHVSSCHQQQTIPAPPEFSSAQRAMWQLAPEDALGAMVIGDFGHLLGRLRAFKAVLDTGPATRGYLEKGTALGVAALGFDPLDPEGWRKVGSFAASRRPVPNAIQAGRRLVSGAPCN